jgi:hypothetical protein
MAVMAANAMLQSHTQVIMAKEGLPT